MNHQLVCITCWKKIWALISSFALKTGTKLSLQIHRAITVPWLKHCNTAGRTRWDHLWHRALIALCTLFVIYSSSGKYSLHFTFSTFCHERASLQKGMNSCLPQNSTHNTSQSQCDYFLNFANLLKTILRHHLYTSTYSLLNTYYNYLLCTFNSNYSLKSFWI